MLITPSGGSHSVRARTSSKVGWLIGWLLLALGCAPATQLCRGWKPDRALRDSLHAGRVGPPYRPTTRHANPRSAATRPAAPLADARTRAAGAAAAWSRAAAARAPGPAAGPGNPREPSLGVAAGARV